MFFRDGARLLKNIGIFALAAAVPLTIFYSCKKDDAIKPDLAPVIFWPAEWTPDLTYHLTRQKMLGTGDTLIVNPVDTVVNGYPVKRNKFLIEHLPYYPKGGKHIQVSYEGIIRADFYVLDTERYVVRYTGSDSNGASVGAEFLMELNRNSDSVLVRASLPDNPLHGK